MSKWQQLDLINPCGHPQPGQLTALRLIPSNDRSAFYSREQYDIGTFQADPQTGRKLWWHGAHGTQDPTRMKKHYTIWWCEVPDFSTTAAKGGNRWETC